MLMFSGKNNSVFFYTIPEVEMDDCCSGMTTSPAGEVCRSKRQGEVKTIQLKQSWYTHHHHSSVFNNPGKTIGPEG
jgi:hypothetical protein